MANTIGHEIEQRAQDALDHSSIHALRSLRVEQKDDQLVISGRLGTFYHKQLAQELIREVAGDVQVVNAIDVD